LDAIEAQARYSDVLEEIEFMPVSIRTLQIIDRHRLIASSWLSPDSSVGRLKEVPVRS
jgi:hypothetical protein